MLVSCYIPSRSSAIRFVSFPSFLLVHLVCLLCLFPCRVSCASPRVLCFSPRFKLHSCVLSCVGMDCDVVVCDDIVVALQTAPTAALHLCLALSFQPTFDRDLFHLEHVLWGQHLGESLPDTMNRWDPPCWTGGVHTIVTVDHAKRLRSLLHCRAITLNMDSLYVS